MRIEHVAIWVQNLESMKNFYTQYFGGIANQKYSNLNKGFASYFIKFADGARLELMHSAKNEDENENHHHTHIAFSVGSKATVDALTETLRNQGYRILSEPRITGDGYYESCVLDPEHNQIEITI